MSAGAKRHKVIIEQRSISNNSIGEPVETWSKFSDLWAQITPVSGKEYFSAQKERSKVSHKIKTRFVAGINTKMRINFGGRLFDIESVINFQERNRELEIMAVENV